MQLADIDWDAQLDLEMVKTSLDEAITSKKLFRYQFKDGNSPANILEKTICKYLDIRFSLGVSSATNAIFLALKALGVDSTSKVLIPAFTFTAVPSAVIQCGAEPILVDITDQYVLDLVDLELKIVASDAKYLLLSHMRGHLCNMDKVVDICKKYSISLIEDAAHALGVKWNGKYAGTFGIAGIYSLQSYKILNCGEGGILVTNDPDTYWKSVFMSGSYENNYMLHNSNELNLASTYKNKLPVFNVRMNNITASIAIPQIKNLEITINRVNKNYDLLKSELSSNSLISFNKELNELRPVRDSAQFRIKLRESERSLLKEALNTDGVPVSYFGGANNTNARLYQNWHFLDIKKANLPNTRKNLSEVFDLRLPIHFNEDNIKCIAEVIIRNINKFC